MTTPCQQTLFSDTGSVRARREVRHAPLHVRARDTSSQDTLKLYLALRSAAKAIKTMLNHVQPLFIPHAVGLHLQAVVFADAYVRAGHITPDVKLPRHTRDDKGWGYVVRIGCHVFYSHGKTPNLSLTRSLHGELSSMPSRPSPNACPTTGSRSLITRRVRPPAFTDNTAGKAARKGSLRQQHAGSLLGDGGQTWMEA